MSTIKEKKYVLKYYKIRAMFVALCKLSVKTAFIKKTSDWM